MSAAMSPSDFTARLIVDFCLLGIIGQEKGRPPVEGANVIEEARLKLGLKPGGRTVRYPLDAAPVFLDVHEAESQVFFRHAEARTAYDTINTAVKAAFPDLALDDTMLAPPRRRRLMRVRLNEENLALLEVIDPTDDAPPEIQDFAARVSSYRKTPPPNAS